MGIIMGSNYKVKDTTYILSCIESSRGEEYIAQKNHIATKIVETEWMLSVIEKEELDKSLRYYLSFNLSQLKNILSKRLKDFAEAETHRDFNCLHLDFVDINL